jgi:hypothetical protein
MSKPEQVVQEIIDEAIEKTGSGFDDMAAFGLLRQIEQYEHLLRKIDGWQGLFNQAVSAGEVDSSRKDQNDKDAEAKREKFRIKLAQLRALLMQHQKLDGLEPFKNLEK